MLHGTSTQYVVSEAMHMKMGWVGGGGVRYSVCVERSVVQSLRGHILSLA